MLASMSQFFEAAMSKNIERSLLHQKDSAAYVYDLWADNAEKFFANPFVESSIESGAEVEKIYSTAYFYARPTLSIPADGRTINYCSDFSIFSSMNRVQIAIGNSKGAVVGRELAIKWCEELAIDLDELLDYDVYLWAPYTEKPYFDSIKITGIFDKLEIPHFLSPVDPHPTHTDQLILPLSHREKALSFDSAYWTTDVVIDFGRPIESEEASAMISVLSDYDVKVKSATIATELAKFDKALFRFVRAVGYMLAVFAGVASFLFLQHSFSKKIPELRMRWLYGMPQRVIVTHLLFFSFLSLLLGMLICFGAQVLISWPLLSFLGEPITNALTITSWSPLAAFYISFLVADIVSLGSFSLALRRFDVD